MKKVFINNKEYIFIQNFKDNAMYRKSFNELTQKTYGFDFEQWYQNGYWGSSYMPYSLLDGDQIVANVSASVIDFEVLGESKRYIQIGTVMTDKVYRNQGLSRYLIEKILEDWKDQCDMIYLFANDTVLDFYPKFGFTAVKEYQFSKSVTKDNESNAAEKLDMSLDCNRKLVEKLVTESVPLSKIKMKDNLGLIMFYLTAFKSGEVYYIREQNIVAVADYGEDTLYLQDIFMPSKVDINSVINLLTNMNIKTVCLGFTPIDTESFNVNLLDEKDTTLFVMNDKADLFQNHNLMFPVLSHT